MPPARRKARRISESARAPPRRSGPAKRRRPRDRGCRRCSPARRVERVEGGDRHAERRRFRLDVALLAVFDDAHDVVVHAARQPRQRIGHRRGADDDQPSARARTARRRRRPPLPRRTSSARRRARRSPRLRRRRPAESTPGGCTAPPGPRAPACRMISREHAPPTNPSMRPSANTIARSPRWADTGARRATTVATANDCPSRRKIAICSKRSIVHPGGFAPRSPPTGSLAGPQRPAPLARLTRCRSFALFVR